jgi:hypothetical protein
MNPNKCISANSKGITINFGDVNKHRFVYYENSQRIQNDTKYQEFEKPEFNKIQKELYAQAVYGVKVIPNQVLMQMHHNEIRKIQDNHNRAKNVINLYKQEVSNKQLDALLLKLIPKSPIVKQMVSVKGTDSSVSVTVTLKDLKITPKMVAERLVKFGILPENFFNLV